MTRPEIPLEVLGLLAPILSWVENSRYQALPKTWATEPFRASSLKRDLSPHHLAASVQERDWLLGQLPTYSLDTIDDVAGYARGVRIFHPTNRWQPTLKQLAPPQSYNLCRVFDHLVTRYLTWNGGKVAIRSGRMVEFHELGLRLSLSCIVRHTHAKAVASGYLTLDEVSNLPEFASLLPSDSHGMRSVVRRGLTEGHLHLNSIHATEISWADHLLKPLRWRPRSFDSVEWRLLQFSRSAARTLALALAMRRSRFQVQTEDYQRIFHSLDAMYFADSVDSMAIPHQSFKKAFSTMAQSFLASRSDQIVDSWRSYRRGPKAEAERADLDLLHWLAPTDRRMWLGQFDPRYRRSLTQPDREHLISSLHLMAHLELVSQAGGGSSVTNNNTNSSSQRRGIEPTSEFLHEAFFRYLVCQTHHWQHAVQQGRTTGLRHFKYYFNSRQRRLIDATDREKADSALRRVNQWRGLRVLEGRIAPPRRLSDILPWLQSFANTCQQSRIEKFGLVVHFIKEAESEKFNPLSTRHRLRFADLRARYRRQAFDLFRILERPSLAAPFIVGIDAANLELKTPPEVFAPVFRFLREFPIGLRSNREPDNELAQPQIRSLIERRRLGMTYHVGEEFRHLLSGLRAIAEVIEFLAPQPGDRLGHAIALGLDPQTWLEHVGYQALVSKQEWLDTLAWIHFLLGAGDDLIGRLQIENRIEQLGGEIYHSQAAKPITPLVVHSAWKLRQLDPAHTLIKISEKRIEYRPLSGDDTATWRWNRISRGVLEHVVKEVGGAPPLDLLSDYWYNPETRKQGGALHLVDMEADRELWLELCLRVQKRVQNLVALKELTIEINPSANRIIGPMSRYTEHHIFNLTYEAQKWQRRIRVTVNTDNPGTANTSLAHEYYLLGEALIKQGRPEVEVVEWLDWLRKTGEEASFVQQLPGQDHPAMKSVLAQIKKLRQPLRELRDSEVCLKQLWESWPRRTEPGASVQSQGSRPS